MRLVLKRIANSLGLQGRLPPWQTRVGIMSRTMFSSLPSICPLYRGEGCWCLCHFISSLTEPTVRRTGLSAKVITLNQFSRGLSSKMPVPRSLHRSPCCLSPPPPPPIHSTWIIAWDSGTESPKNGSPVVNNGSMPAGPQSTWFLLFCENNV